MVDGYELCPHCWNETEYEVEEGVMIARCKECGKYLVLCSICPTDCWGCGDCKYEKEAKRLNGEEV